MGSCCLFYSDSTRPFKDRYLNGISADSRAAKSTRPFLYEDQVEQTVGMVKQLNEIAKNCHHSLAEMALAWNLRKSEIVCVLLVY